MAKRDSILGLNLDRLAGEIVGGGGAGSGPDALASSGGGLDAMPLASAAHRFDFAGAEIIRANGITLIDASFAARGGGGGGAGGGGSGGDPSLLTKYTSKGADNNAALDYNVDIAFKGSNWTKALQSAFTKAANYLSAIITDDIANVLFRGKVIDDIKIDAELVAIDGVNGVLGQAGPTAYRTANFLPAAAIMQFDVADAANFDSIGRFDDIVLHEMMHSIGFGTMWDLMGLTAGSIEADNLEFIGENAMAAYGEQGGSGGVPVETDGGPGTAGGHWDDATFTNELMTGYIGSPGNSLDENYVSQMTVAALEDMGYATLWGSAVASWPGDPIN